jgi:GT2 family glycosyltransferase
MELKKSDCPVVLLWYGKPKLAMRALTAIAGLEEIDPDLVYCYDNGSEAAHGIEVRAAFPGFRHRAAAKNGGYAGGFNAALAWAFADGHDHALFLTSDTEPTPGALALCLDSAERFRADLIAPQVRFRRPPHPLDAWGGFFDPAACQLGHYRAAPQADCLHGPWDYIPGTALWLRRTAFETLGGVDETFFMYWEDADFCLRAHRAGLVLARSPGVILHGGGETCAKKPLYTTFYYLRNRIRFCRLHLSGREREAGLMLLQKELETLFERWSAHGDSLRCEYIPLLRQELAL